MNYQNRLEKLFNQFSSDCEALLIEDPINLKYLTGMDLSLGKLLIQEKESFLYVDNRYFESCLKKAPMTVLASEKHQIHEKLRRGSKLGIDSEFTSYQNFINLQSSLEIHLIELIPLKNPLAKIRAIKDPEELILLKQAASLCYEGYEFARNLLEDGLSEIQVANELEIFWKRKGSQGLSFDPIIAFEANSSMPHYRAGSTLLTPNTTVLIDIGVKIHDYHSDMTRTFFRGTASPKLQEIYAIVEEAKNRALDLCKPGVLIGDLDLAARDFITEKGYGDYFNHSLGHGIGLEVHEWPLIRNREPFAKVPLQKNMVITIEPGIYLPEIGGVRLEDTIAITDDGYEILTRH